MSWNLDYSSISEISAVLEKNGLSMTKKFGQNFLISLPSLEKIVDLALVSKGTRVWEIGPGMGALTNVMLKRGAEVTAFEIDHGFCRILREQAFADESGFRLIEGDALKTWLPEFRNEGAPDVICANLPYNVGSVLIASFIENRCIPRKMVYTLQSEVVSRICASKGSENYSGFSVLTSLDYENREALHLKAGCFFPKPNVDSSVVVMTRREEGLVKEEDSTEFISFIRCAFSQRRKTLRNNLKTLNIQASVLDNAFEKTGILTSARAEEMDTSTLYRFFEYACKAENQTHS